jgi:hypothetical protein
MPGPSRLIGDVANAIAEGRSMGLRVPAAPIPGIKTALEAALHRAHRENEKTRWIRVTDDVDISAAVGSHYGVPSLQPEVLATHGISIRTIILDPLSEAAAQKCEAYFDEFVGASLGNSRNLQRPTLLALLPEPLGSARTPVGKSSHEIVYSGAFTPEEMHAYVAVRMTDRSGPGTTGLLRALVMEFAGIDPWLAEELIAMPDDTLLGVPRSLDPVLLEHEGRWRSGRWAAGCFADIAGQRHRHVLYEMYLAAHVGPEQQNAKEWLKRRYWRACLRSLLPWLEERRARVIETLRRALEQHLSPHGGQASQTLPTGRTVLTDISDLEFNRIVGMKYHEGFTVRTQKEQLAVDVCISAKRVRDDLAHLRPPEIRTLMELAERMTRLLGE